MRAKDEDYQIDFTAEDRGGYKNPERVGDVPYEKLERFVFRALKANFRTLMRIKEHAGLPRGFDLSPVIDGMQLDKKIRAESNGTITAFFLYNERVKRFWLEGDGTVEAVFEKNGRETRVQFHGPVAPSEPVEITYALMQVAAAALPDTDAIAREFRLTPHELRKRIKQDPDLKDAFDRGRNAFAAKQKRPEPKQQALRKPEKPKEQETEKPMNTAATTARKPHSRAKKGIVYTAEMFRDAAARGLSQSAFAKSLGMSSASTIYLKMQKPEFKKAWDEGLAKRNGRDAAAAAEAPEAAKRKYKKRDAGKDASGPTAGLVKVPAVETIPEPELKVAVPAVATVSHRYLSFESGAQVLIGFEGNFFTATREERKFLNRLAEMFEEYPA